MLPGGAVVKSLLTLVLSLAVCALSADTAQPPPAAQPLPTAEAVPLAHIPGVETDTSFTPDKVFSDWPHISLKEAQRLLPLKGVVFADARSKVEWDQAHIPGALPVPLGEFDAAYKKNEGKFKRARFIVVYCHGVGCRLSDMACMDFRKKGYRNVVGFYGGWPAWSTAALPVQDLNGKISVPKPQPSPQATPTPAAHP
jgi:rhodanese-related sulfurtransferase